MGIKKVNLRIEADKINRWVVGSLILLTAGPYWVWRSLKQSGDSLAYASSITTGNDLFHPHHILFAPVVRMFLLVAQWLGLSTDALVAAQIHNLLWAVVAVVSIYLTIKIILDSRFWAIGTALALLVSNGMFAYATQAEVYVPATGCAAVAILILTMGHKNGWSSGKLVWLSIFFALAVLYHQTNLLFAVPLAMVLLFDSMRKGWRILFIVTGLSVTLVLGTYALAYASTGAPLTVTDFLHFFLEYTYHPNRSWGTFEHFNPTGVALLLKSQLRCVIYLPPGRSMLLLMVVGLFGGALVGFIALTIKQVLRRTGYRMLRLALIVWLVVNFTFFLWWLPGEDEFFITTLIPLILTISITLHYQLNRPLQVLLKKTFPLLVATTLLLIMTVNFRYSILPRVASRGDAYKDATRLNALVKDDCTILTGYDEMQNLRYYYQRDNVIELAPVLLYAYHQGNIPDNLRPAADKPILVPVDSVIPAYGAVGTDGNADRAGWLMFFEYLFDVQENFTESGKSSRAFEVVRDSEGTQYVRLSVARIEITDLNELFTNLDQQIETPAGENSKPFASWYKR